MIQFIDPLALGSSLLEVEKPNRYVGGEYGRLAKPLRAVPQSATQPAALPADPSEMLQTAIAFPDLYEIGMSNQALRIIYNGLNRIEGISCDRAFATAPDFEALIRKNGVPLYGLDTGIALGGVDVLMFTFGYELGITGVLAMMDCAGIPIRASDRGESDPIVIMGGPCVSNPLPYARFIDAFWIGEAEAGFFGLMEQARDLKRAGEGRAALLECIASHPSVWASAKQGAGHTVRRAVDAGFAERGPSAAVFPIPNMKVVQHHGAVEIMRGCPNGCRFCHAGYWYRPMRQKSAETILKEAEAFIRQGGYREVSLSSLSSGDFDGLDSVVDSLNAAHACDHVSFQLPSLRVSTFSLPLLDKISEVRKSGLTFAVETPVDAWQMSINKEVSRENVVNILLEAKKHGWRGAKFYFMIGLPVGSLPTEGFPAGSQPVGEAQSADKPPISGLPADGAEAKAASREEDEIISFVLEVSRRANMHFNVNVGTFIPKPHTPFQWAGQLDEETSRRKLEYIRNKLKQFGHKVSVQDPFISVVEGVLSRGGERVGDIIEQAFLQGCRLDAWSEYLRKDVWRDLLEKNKVLTEGILGEKRPDADLPWQEIDAGVSKNYLKREFDRSNAQEITSVCIEKCTHQCGICTDNQKIVKNIIQSHVKHDVEKIKNSPVKNDAPTHRIVFTFSKTQGAVFHSHLSIVEIFSMAFLRAGIPVRYSEGFNPLPRLEIASPLSIGITAAGEAAAVDTDGFVDAREFARDLNEQLPAGLRIVDAMNVFIPVGEKKRSLSALLWGYAYRNASAIDSSISIDYTTDYVKAAEEKAYRVSRTACRPNGSVYGMERLAVLAKSADAETGRPYFEVYRELYPVSDHRQSRWLECMNRSKRLILEPPQGGCCC